MTINGNYVMQKYSKTSGLDYPVGGNDSGSDLAATRKNTVPARSMLNPTA